MEKQEGAGLRGGESIWAQDIYQALVGVVQLLQDLIHYGVGQVGDNGELHLTVGTGGAVELLPASPLGLHPFSPQLPERGTSWLGCLQSTQLLLAAPWVRYTPIYTCAGRRLGSFQPRRVWAKRN